MKNYIMINTILNIKFKDVIELFFYKNILLINKNNKTTKIILVKI
jgi:hypothetical protein